MGKAAKNEKIKLRAAFYNNIAVALMGAGTLLPILALYSRFPDMTPGQMWIFLGSTGLGCLTAFSFSLATHSKAVSILDKIED
jgi:hypothetical protein